MQQKGRGILAELKRRFLDLTNASFFCQHSQSPLMYYHNNKILASVIRRIFILLFNIKYLAKEVADMNKLKIPENHSGVSKTLRLPENIVNDIQNFANLKNLSFNKVVISLLEFSLHNLEEEDKEKIESLKNNFLFR